MRLLTCRPERAKTRHLEKQGKTIPAVAVALFLIFTAPAFAREQPHDSEIGLEDH
jgi:hypothetical protein